MRSTKCDGDTYVAVSEFALFVACTDHRVVDGVVVPLRLIADVTVDEWQHRLHQLVGRVTVS